MKVPALLALGLLAAAAFVLPAGVGRANPPTRARGQEILAQKECLGCHRVGGHGGSGSDLLFASGGEWSRAGFVASLWNHGPRMWRLFEEKGAEFPSFTAADVESLFLALDEMRSFAPGKAGDRARGRLVFEAKGCGECHERLAVVPSGQSSSIALLTAQLWRDIPRMMDGQGGTADGGKKNGNGWPRLEPADVRDLLAFCATSRD